MKILVLGGSRFLGKAFVEEALKQNHEITLFNRGNHNTFTDVEVIIGDRFGDLSGLKGRYWDTVLDTSGYVPSTVRRSTELLGGQAGQYTFISSISVYKDWSKENMDESAPVLEIAPEKADELSSGATGPLMEYYGEFKALCEREAERNMPGRVLNVRAGLLVGPDDYSDRFTYWINRVARGGRVLAPGSPKRKIQFIDIRDLGKWLLLMMENKAAGTYNATGPESPLEMGALLETIQAVSGSNAEIKWVDETFLLERKVAPWTEMPLWLPETNGDSVNTAKGGFSFNIDKALRSGLLFSPVEKTVRDTLTWDLTRNCAELKAGISPEKEKILLKEWEENKAESRS
ncbi:SDR family oxidoreductase [Neobacillus sp. YIM B06451]|uniref:SDR family oxidoreductase n=1 Tax=Neobacillus sp. YIM B06451 TaxID=3070994 RepID=UPI00292D34A2|nr:SDR family oxidoreductase [Neobacillus sp. YIM B06451]